MMYTFKIKISSHDQVIVEVVQQTCIPQIRVARIPAGKQTVLNAVLDIFISLSKRQQRNEAGYEEYCVLVSDPLHSHTSSPTFQRNILCPSSWSKSKPSEQISKHKTAVLSLFARVTSSILNMEAVPSSETSVNLYQTTRHQIVGDSILHSLTTRT
jgi:hypothetical protein